MSRELKGIEMDAESIDADSRCMVDAFVAHVGSSSHAARDSFCEFTTVGIASVLASAPALVWGKHQFLVGGQGGSKFRLKHVKSKPNECRLLDKTYSAVLNVDVVDARSGAVVVDVDIGEIPLMVGCAPCKLHKASASLRVELGECACDGGGYFVIAGKEKAVANFEARSPGAVVNRLPMRLEDTHTVLAFAGNCFVTRTKHGIYWLRLFAPGVSGVLHIPFVTALRCLETTSDRDLVDLVCTVSGGALTKSACHRHLMPTLEAAAGHGPTCTTARQAVKKLAGLPGTTVVVRMIRACFPGAVNDSERCLSLASVVYECISLFSDTPQGWPEIKDLDKFHSCGGRTVSRASLKAKRVVTPGEYMRTLLAIRWAELIQKANGILTGPVSTPMRGGDVAQIQRALVDTGMEQYFVSAFRSTTLHPAVYDVPRLTAQGVASYVSRIVDGTAVSDKEIQPRKVHATQLGFVCMLETPEGEHVGQVKHLAVMATVSGMQCAQQSSQIRRELLKLGVSMLPTSGDGNVVPVLLDGVALGLTQAPDKLCGQVRELRRSGRLHRHVSVEWKLGTCVHVRAEEGRIVRPLVLAEGMSQLRAGVGTPPMKWSECCKVSDKTQVPLVEEVDAHEASCALIAIWPKELTGRDPAFTHAEIHPSAVLSAVACMLPFPDRNAAPRNVFSCKHMKTCASVFATNFRSRMDTDTNILHAGQRPLVSSDWSSMGFSETQLPFGVNAIVAIASFTGYNQEDAVIINEASLQRGLFATTHVHTIVADENVREHNFFCNPASQMVAPRAKSYEGMGESGLPTEGAHVRPGDAIVGRILRSDPAKVGALSSQDIASDTSIICDLATRGTVQRAILYQGPEGRRAKVCLYETRTPVVGDKFASRHGQKGVCGHVVPSWDMPCTTDGLVPDMIINPHAFPTRTTMGQFVEGIAAKAMCIDGGAAPDGTAMCGGTTDDIATRLSEHAEMWGGDVLADPRTGIT